MPINHNQPALLYIAMPQRIKPLIVKCVFFLALGFSGLSLADTSIVVYDIKGLHNSAHTGRYDQIIKRAQQQGLSLDIKFEPISRAKHSFRTHKVDCISPSDSSTDPFPFATVQTAPLNHAKAYIFSRPEDGIITDVAQLANLVVGVRTGMQFGDKLSLWNINVQPARSMDLNYKKLMSH